MMTLDPLPATRRLTIIDPTVDARWEAFVQAHPRSDVFHTTAWARVLMETYGYEPRYHIAENAGGEIVAGWPAMLVDSRLTGKRLISLPFCDHCRPLITEQLDAESLLDALIEDQTRLGAKMIEVRGWPSGGPAIPRRLTPSLYYNVFASRLNPDPDLFFKGINAATRRYVRQAQKRGVTVRPADSPEDITKFYALNLLLRRRHGMLPQPRSLFNSIYRNFVEAGSGQFLLAEADHRTVAGVLFITHRDRVYDKFAPSDPDFWNLRPNHLVLWKSLEWSCLHGFRHYDMGRVGANDTGLADFKEQWGATGQPMPYCYHPTPGGFNVTQPEGIKKRALGVFARFAPDPVFVAAGERLYRHLG